MPFPEGYDPEGKDPDSDKRRDWGDAQRARELSIVVREQGAFTARLTEAR